MIDLSVIKKIEDFVFDKPRSINEIALLIKKNWRTADRYINYINENFGTISSRTFRGGTRGALKVVFWAGLNERKGSVFQKILQQQIEMYKRKEDFSSFDIYQHVPENNKKATIEKQDREENTNLLEFIEFLNQTKKQLLIFSGNLSWINLKNKDADVFNVIEDLVKNNISIKIISRVDLTTSNNLKKLLDLNFKYGKELIEVRHREQPLRGFVSDNKCSRIKEIKEPTGKLHELNQKLFIFYTIKDKEWVEWLSKNFWDLFSKSIDSNKRIEQINLII